jgi:hypothetical protein
VGAKAGGLEHRQFPGSINIINNLALTWTNIATSRHARGGANIAEAERLSRTSDSIDWMKLECLVT